jgi:methyl-accepting chemotaxis protein
VRDLHGTLQEDRKDKVKSQVESAAGLIRHFQSLAKSGQLNEADAKKAAIESLRGVRYSGSEYFFIFNTEYVYQLLPTKPEFEGQNKGDMKDTNGKLIIVEMVKAAQAGGGYVDYFFSKPGSPEPAPKISYATLIPEWNWVVGTGVYVDDIDQVFRMKMLFGFVQLLVLAILLAALAWQITRSILRQLGGEPVDGIRVMQRVAEGDLQVDVGNPPAGSMLAALGAMVSSLRGVIQDITRDAQTLDQRATQVANSSREISVASGRQADATTSMAAAMEELTVSINHISNGSGTAEQASLQATGLASDGVVRVREATASIESISGSVSNAGEQIRLLDSKAREISGIAAEIKQIAGQTNLLALNAAIEAARAGEQGRGFAVVADEVRKLAERTSVATVNIEQMLSSVQSETQTVVGVMDEVLPQVDRGVALSRGVASLLEEIHASTEMTLGHLREVASATREQGVASNSIAVQVEEVSQMAEETSTTVQLAAESASGIEHVAHNLNAVVARFRL